MTPTRATAVIVGAGLGGLLLGAAVPTAARHRGPGARGGVGVPPVLAVGRLPGSDTEGRPRLRRSAGMLLLHHAVSSLPLIVLGLVLGLDTPLGAGAFLLGAVTPAAGLPGFAAAGGVPVRRVLT